jgi:gluconolactonase
MDQGPSYTFATSQTLPDPRIEVLDERFLALRLLSGTVEMLATGFYWAEGPVWFGDWRYLLFSDIPNNRILRWDDASGAPGAEGAPGRITEFRRPSNHANGLARDTAGRLLACEHGTRRVTRTEADGKITVLAERYEGKRLNSPNDVVVKSDGAIYFTDPSFGVKREQQELDFQGVYRISPDGKTLKLVAKDFLMPNGLAFTPDEKVLYINDTSRGHIRAFDVAADGTLGNGRVFADRTPGADGMKVDTAGNVYCTSAAGVMVFDRGGKRLGTFSAPEQPANCAFGDSDWKSLYMTCRTGLYRVRIAVPGVKTLPDRP